MLKDSLLTIITKYYSKFVHSLIAFEYCSLSWIHQQSTVDTAGRHWTFAYMYVITVHSQGRWQDDRGLGSGLWAIPGYVMVCETQGSKQTVTYVTKCSLPATQYVLKPLWSRRNYKLCKPHYIYSEMKEKERGRAVNLFKQIERTQWLFKKIKYYQNVSKRKMEGVRKL